MLSMANGCSREGIPASIGGGVSRKSFVSLKECGEVRASGLPNTVSLAQMVGHLGRRVRVGSSAPSAPGGSVRPESLPAPK